MKVPYSWLKELVPCDLPVEELAHGMTMQGLNVEAVKYLGEGLDDVLVGQVLTCEKHPNADKLTYCKVTDGMDVVDAIAGVNTGTVAGHQDVPLEHVTIVEVRQDKD